jgi:hypothetical protein
MNQLICSDGVTFHLSGWSESTKSTNLRQWKSSWVIWAWKGLS